MPRPIHTIAFAAMVLSTTGCASNWDQLTSKRFRDKPFGTLFQTDDPIQTLRTSPEGDERARAMLRLKEPMQAGKSQSEQDEVMQILTTAATADGSPWVRIAAIDALGRFQDPRAPEVLATAYHTALGRPQNAPAPPSSNGVVAVGARSPVATSDRFSLNGPQGFAPDQVMMIRGRAVEALAKTNRPEAVTFLSRVASGELLALNEDPISQDFVRQRAVTGLGSMRTKEAVVALNAVLTAESNKDIAMRNLAHEGLVKLTGQKLPPEPEKWNEIVQAGSFEVASEPGSIKRALDTVVPR